MADPKPIRETREALPMRGIGGFMEFFWPKESGQPLSRIQIREWTIEHEYFNARLAMTGGIGSIQYRRVADSFSFTTIADMDLRTSREAYGGPDRGSVNQPFYDGRMEGRSENNFLIKMRFQCGDPTFWTDPDLQSIARVDEISGLPGHGIYHSSEQVILDLVTLVDSAHTGKVLSYLIKGHGSRPLQRYAGQVWCGGGAFGLSGSLQEQVQRAGLVHA